MAKKEQETPKQETPKELGVITVNAPKVGKNATITYKIGKTLEENIGLFGETIVNDYFTQQLVVRVQAGARTALENGVDPQKWADSYVPGQRVSVAKDPKAAARQAISMMSEEEKAQLLRDLMGQ